MFQVKIPLLINGLANVIIPQTVIDKGHKKGRQKLYFHLYFFVTDQLCKNTYLIKKLELPQE
jgi:hypothetical protein